MQAVRQSLEESLASVNCLRGRLFRPSSHTPLGSFRRELLYVHAFCSDEHVQLVGAAYHGHFAFWPSYHPFQSRDRAVAMYCVRSGLSVDHQAVKDLFALARHGEKQRLSFTQSRLFRQIRVLS